MRVRALLTATAMSVLATAALAQSGPLVLPMPRGASPVGTVPGVVSSPSTVPGTRTYSPGGLPQGAIMPQALPQGALPGPGQAAPAWTPPTFSGPALAIPGAPPPPVKAARPAKPVPAPARQDLPETQNADAARPAVQPVAAKPEAPPPPGAPAAPSGVAAAPPAPDTLAKARTDVRVIPGVGLPSQTGGGILTTLPGDTQGRPTAVKPAAAPAPETPIAPAPPVVAA